MRTRVPLARSGHPHSVGELIWRNKYKFIMSLTQPSYWFQIKLLTLSTHPPQKKSEINYMSERCSSNEYGQQSAS